MKAVLISINPKWCSLIASGRKTLEVRKTRPKLVTPFKCYIYETKGKHIGHTKHTEGVGKVIGEFTCDSVLMGFVGYKDHHASYHDLLNGSCLSRDELMEYGNWNTLYGWHISDLKIYDEPKQLSEFYKCGAPAMEDLDDELCIHCSATDYGDKKECHTPRGVSMCEGKWCADAYWEYLDDEFALTRPPQSWCYVEEETT